jgi:hypothetical protein
MCSLGNCTNVSRSSFSATPSAGGNSQPAAAISRACRNGRRRQNIKVSTGLGRKRVPWVSVLYEDVHDQFQLLRCAGCKISTSVLRRIGVKLLEERKENIYGRSMNDPLSKKTMESRITTSREMRFQDKHSLRSRKQAGKLQLPLEKTEEMERAVATHLGQLQREFRCGELDEDFVENGDETHFFINMGNKKPLAPAEDKEIKYADVVSGGQGMTMFVRLSGGARSQLHPAFLVFQSTGSYPIRGIKDNVPGVSYRVEKMGWMDRKVRAEYFDERCEKLLSRLERV